jgi:cyclase
MLRPRVIPCLLVRDRGLVKTVGFENARYVGDPINAVRIFNEKQVDELMVLDIDATTHGRKPDYAMIRHLAEESRMPLCYGGGVRSIDQAREIIALGVEKVAVSAAAIARPALVAELAEQLGAQSVVVVIDIRKTRGGQYEIWTHNATRRTGKVLEAFIAEVQDLGAGEIVINSVDNDGRMAGYDLVLASAARAATTLPLTVLGGAGSFADIERLTRELGVIGAAAGSLFVFKGAFRAVLINYPSAADRDRLVANAAAAP